MYVEIVRKSVESMPIHVGFNINPADIRKISDIHYHDEEEILAVTDGEMRVDIFDKSISLAPGDVLLISGRTPHSTFISKNGTRSYLLQFDINYFWGGDALSHHKTLRLFLNNSFGDYLNLKSSDAISGEIMDTISQILSECSKKEVGYELAIKGLLSILIARLQRKNPLHYLTNYDFDSLNRLMPAIDYMERNFSDMLTLCEISQTVNVSPYYFCRLFKQATGQTVFQYLNFVRISEAEKMLSSDKRSITEIASTVGFSDVRYFNRIFKKMKSCTPCQYRRFKYSKSSI